MKLYMDQGPAYGVSSHPWTEQPASPGVSDDSGVSTTKREIPEIDTRVNKDPAPITPSIVTPSPADLIEPDSAQLDGSSLYGASSSVYDSPKPDGSSLYRAPSSVYENDTSESREPVSYAAAAAASAGPSPLAQHENAEPEEEQHASEPKQQNDQNRTETYSIQHVNWKNSSGELLDSPILIQNENGPCPLLALVNSLVLSSKHDGQSPVVKALQAREQVSLGLLIEALFDELTAYLGPDGELPDIEALSHFLTMLHTGMNVNPRLTLVRISSVCVGDGFEAHVKFRKRVARWARFFERAISSCTAHLGSL